MSLPLGFTKRHLDIWSMRRNGLSLAEIGRRLGVTRQAVHNSVGDIDNKISQTLKSVASAAKIEARHIDTTKGVLLGYSHETNNRVIVTFSSRHGAQIWHYHTGKCEGCMSLETCREVIIGEAEERAITLTKEDKDRAPAELARIVFSKVIPGLEP